MANTVRIKRRISGAAGAPSSLKNAELAFNEVSGILYYGKGDDGSGTATSIIQVAGDGAFATKDYVDTALTNSNLSQYAKLAASNTFAESYTNTFNGTVNLAGTFQISAVSVTASAAELNVLDGITATTAELNILDGVTATYAEINVLDGITATTAELNVLDGITATTAELNILDGVTATYSEINVLDGITSTTAELNILDGATVTYAELNLLDGSISETVVNGKAVIYGDAGEVVATSASTTAGLVVGTTLSAADGDFTVDAAGNVIVGGNLTITGNFIINGTTTTINSTVTTLDDPIITLGGDTAPTVNDAKDRGVEYRWHNGTAAKVGFFGYDDSTGRFVFIPDATNSSEVFSGSLGSIDVGSVYIGGAQTLSSTALGSAVVSSSLTSVGTLASGTWQASTIAVSYGGTGATTAADARTNLGLVIGTDVQAYNSTLAAVAGGTYTGDDSITTVGTITAGTWTGTTIAVANGGTGATNASDARSNLGLVIGTDVQAYNSTLAAVAGGTYTGASSITTVGTISSGTWSGTTIAVANGGTGATTAADARTNLGLIIGTDIQAYNSTLAAVAGGTYTGDDSITTVGTITTGTWTGTAIAVANGGTGATNAADARTNLGLVIGTDVQAYDAELAALAGLSSAADKLPYFTGAGSASLATFTTFGRSLVDDNSASDARTTLGLGTIATQDANNVAITGGTIDNVIIDGGVF